MSDSAAVPSSILPLVGIVLAVNCGIALAALLASWALGGAGFKDSLYGDYAIPLLVAGMAAGEALRRATSSSGRGRRILPS